MGECWFFRKKCISCFVLWNIYDILDNLFCLVILYKNLFFRVLNWWFVRSREFIFLGMIKKVDVSYIKLLFLCVIKIYKVVIYNEIDCILYIEIF